MQILNSEIAFCVAKKIIQNHCYGVLQEIHQLQPATHEHLNKEILNGKQGNEKYLTVEITLTIIITESRNAIDCNWEKSLI